QTLARNGSAKLAIAFERADSEVDVPASLVRVAAGHERVANQDHALDVVRRAWEHVGPQNIDALFVPEELVRIAACDVRGRETGAQGFGNDLVLAAIQQLLAHVAHISDVLDMPDAVSQSAQQPLQGISQHIRPQIAKVHGAVHSRPAGIDTYIALRIERNRLDAPRGGIVQAHLPGAVGRRLHARQVRVRSGEICRVKSLTSVASSCGRCSGTSWTVSSNQRTRALGRSCNARSTA